MKPGTYVYCFPILLSAQGSFLLDCYVNQLAFREEEDELSYSFQFLYLVSWWNPASMGNIHLHQDSGPWPLQQCSRQDWKPGPGQHTPGFPVGAIQALAGQVIQTNVDQNSWETLHAEALSTLF